MRHDIYYWDADDKKDGLTRSTCDKSMLDSLSNLENKTLNWNQWFAKYSLKVLVVWNINLN